MNVGSIWLTALTKPGYIGNVESIYEAGHEDLQDLCTYPPRLWYVCKTKCIAKFHLKW